MLKTYASSALQYKGGVETICRVQVFVVNKYVCTPDQSNSGHIGPFSQFMRKKTEVIYEYLCQSKNELMDL